MFVTSALLYFQYRHRLACCGKDAYQHHWPIKADNQLWSRDDHVL